MAGRCPSCGTEFPTDGGYCPNDGTRILSTAPAARDDLIGRSLDTRYEIREPLAAPRAGAIGVMYRGWQVSVAREVAIKVVHSRYAVDIDSVERFLYAGRCACQLIAPAVANTYDVGRTSDGTLYVVSELVRGRSLAETTGTAMPVRRVVGIAIQITDALAAIHRQHLVHGDLDPANIVVEEASVGDQVKLLDVGLACSLGVPAAMPVHTAPELLDSHPPDARSDLYALGCVLHELLAGAPPFTAVSAEALAGKHRRERPPQLPPHVPVTLAAIVHRLLAKAPTDRYATAGDLRAALVAVQAEVGISIPRTSSADLAMPRTRSADLPRPVAPTPFPPVPVAAPPPKSRRLLVIIVVALIASAAGIAAIVLAT